MSTDLVACRLTPDLPAAIATIGIQGSKAVQTVMACCRLSVENLQVGRIHYGLWQVSPSDIAGEQIATSEQVVVCRTGEHAVEVHCHGGTAMSRSLLETLKAAGCQVVSFDAWKPGEGDVSHAIGSEAEAALLHSTTDRAAAVLLDQLNGAWLGLLAQFRKHAIQDQRSAAVELLAKTLSWTDLGLHLSKPWRIVLAGPPNVGKSSIINALTGQEKSIVHAQAGTTRDWLDASTAIDGWPVQLTDTAGVRESSDGIEQAGVERAWSQIDLADLVVIVVDMQVGWTDTHDQLLARAPDKSLIVQNKLDLAVKSQSEEMLLPAEKPDDVRMKHVRISCVSAPGTAPLLKALAAELSTSTPPAGSAVPFRQRHVTLLRKALTEAGEGKLDKADGLLSSIIG